MISGVHNELNVVAQGTLVTFYLLRSQANIYNVEIVKIL